LEKGNIKPISSPCGSRILVVPNKDGSWYMSIDYYDIKNITMKNYYHLPMIDDLLDQLQGSKYFFMISLKLGYHQVRIKEEDTRNITLKIKKGIYELLAMPFGVTNAPIIFMRLVNDVFHPFLYYFIIFYLDDILIFSYTR